MIVKSIKSLKATPVTVSHIEPPPTRVFTSTRRSGSSSRVYVNPMPQRDSRDDHDANNDSDDGPSYAQDIPDDDDAAATGYSRKSSGNDSDDHSANPGSSDSSAQGYSTTRSNSVYGVGRPSTTYYTRGSYSRHDSDWDRDCAPRRWEPRSRCDYYRPPVIIIRPRFPWGSDCRVPRVICDPCDDNVSISIRIRF
jgi:hypothetical protein